jgi:dinuclear metal center YbgI/SA1388 family protein
LRQNTKHQQIDWTDSLNFQLLTIFDRIKDVKMNTIKDVTGYLEKIAPPVLQEPYDNAGLIVGKDLTEIKGILISLDCTEAVLDEALKRNCNLIISHHPIIFSGLKKLNGKNYVERVVIKAIQNNIAIYASHTNLDNVHGGVNKKICDQIGLTNCRILSPKKNILQKLVTFCPNEHAGKVRTALFEAGAGHIGNYDECSYNVEGYGTFRGGEGTQPFAGEKGKQHHENEVRIETVFPSYLQSAIVASLLNAHPYEEVAYDIYSLGNAHQQVGAGMVGELEKEMDEKDFLQHLKTSMRTECIRHTALLNKKVKKVAVCGGAGSFLLNDAIRAAADVFVTGDFKYHQFFDADNKIIIADIGHYESEQFTKELFAELLVKNFSTFAVHLSKTVTNPIIYF